MGCASTRMILPPAVLAEARSRVACWYCLMAVLLTTVPVPTATWSYLGKTQP